MIRSWNEKGNQLLSCITICYIAVILMTSAQSAVSFEKQVGASHHRELPGYLSGIESSCQAADMGLVPG